MARGGASPRAGEVVALCAHHFERVAREALALCVAAHAAPATRLDSAQRTSTRPGTEAKGASADLDALAHWITA